MSSAYNTTLPSPPSLPAHLTVRVVVMRVDGADMTEADFDAAQACFPLAGDDAGAIGKAKTAGKSRPRAKASATKPTKPSSKRAAARRPDGG